MKVLHFSTYYRGAGQSIAANRLHIGMLDNNIDSHMIVSENLIPHNLNLYSAEKYPLHGAKFEIEYLAKTYPNKLPGYVFSPGVVGIDFKHLVNIHNPDIIQLHFITDGFIKLEDIMVIDKPIIWRMSDCYPITGGCHFYSELCGKYLTGCGSCPLLDSNCNKDISNYIYSLKQEIYSKSKITFITPSKWLYQKVKESPLLRDKDVYYIPNGLDTTNEFYPVDKLESRKILKLPMGKKIILYGAVNPGHPRKGLSYLVDALNLISNPQNYHLVIFGTHKDFNLEVPVTVTYLGRVHNVATFRNMYSAADVSVFPSLIESFGQVVTESMACGTPVVTFNNTGPGTIVKHKVTGFISDYKDINGLVQGIEYCTTHNLSILARKTAVEVYNIDKVTNSYLNLYQSLITK